MEEHNGQQGRVGILSHSFAILTYEFSVISFDVELKSIP
jgi:hypothetical protein